MAYSVRAYEVEGVVFRRRRTPLTMQECRDLADKLFAHFGVEPILVQRPRANGRGSRYCGGHPHKIHLAMDAADWLVCHEVAHYVDHHRKGGGPVRIGHDRTWAAIYVEAVQVAGLPMSYVTRLAAQLRKVGVL